MEEVIGAGLLKLIRTIGRYLGYLVIEVIFDTVCYCIGWGLVRLLTFGRYPRRPLRDLHHSSVAADLALSLIGALTLVLAVSAIAHFGG
ncbi:hypothetical protein [Ferrimonas senticii]|uniref:hypothetical protein n=1 Tax=Ferrimonas senticii TaxID=394566 RepID=UPI00041AD43A|nr:hypothetical protein [Ferrimonas senticii]